MAEADGDLVIEGELDVRPEGDFVSGEEGVVELTLEDGDVDLGVGLEPGAAGKTVKLSSVSSSSAAR